MENKIFKFYSDAGHGWLAVKITDLFMLGVWHKISGYSYVRGLTAYLEEDCDAVVFIEQYKKKYGKFHYEKKHVGDRASIRSYDKFTVQHCEKVWKNSREFYDLRENSEV